MTVAGIGTASTASTRGLGGLRVASFAVALVGLGDRLLPDVVHYTGGSPVCAIPQGCEIVQHSSYAKLGGVPVAVLGVVGYVAILALAGARRRDRAQRGSVRRARRLRLLGLADLRRGRAARRDLHWCVGSAICMTLLAVLSVMRMLRAAARPAAVSVKTAGADVAQIPSGPQSAPADEPTGRARRPRRAPSRAPRAAGRRGGR